MPSLLDIAVLLVCACASANASADARLEVTLVHGTPREALAGARLQALVSEYDATPWLCTRRVLIEAGAVPHSHPILTLNTRHNDRPDLLLSTFLHEEMHWYVAAHQRQADTAMAQLRKLYPAIPVGYPEGSDDSDGNYEHLIVIDLEYRADRALLGQSGASAVMDDWAQDHYTWLYRTVRRDESKISAILIHDGLLPPTARPASNPHTACHLPISPAAAP